MKTSTKWLAVISVALSSFMGWMLDPTNLQAINTLLHGHARLLSVFSGAVYLWTLFHQPKANVSGGDPTPQQPAQK